MDPERMTPEREAKMAGIREQIEQGEYRVDPRAVADAVLRRLSELLEVPAGYSACSYPDSATSPTPKSTPPCP